ncbi:hypothetical protein SAMN05421740_105107 [Parapedobacter koreensis]|uniref:Uncharacterized protein n=2 Tax=Parapedobacter koreensis TaxID=332977 RepID=A0A1H7PZV6_9SPHI|nr:hypothetical protein SAMN05421740_105107 [Parapedobacter koreensis]
MTNEDKFIAKSKDFRLHFKLTEDDVDTLLAGKKLKYKGLELGTRTVTLELAEAYPLIYGIEYCDFKKDETTFPEFSELPQSTQDYINDRPEGAGDTVGLKGSKNMASYVVRAIKDYPVGYEFLNVEVLKELPSPLNQASSISWKNGLLKGLVKSMNKYKTYEDENGEPKRGIIYKVLNPVTAELLEKAMKNIEKERLEEKKTGGDPVD